MTFTELAILLQQAKEKKPQQDQPPKPSRPFDPEDTPTPTPVLNPPKPQEDK
jgi:hypothetical protein